jgi:tetratricopeptide (TPR) repeat protein
VQRVLDRVAVKVRVLARTGSSDRQGSLDWMILTGSDTPQAAAASFVANAARALDLPDAPAKLEYPERWETVEAVYRLQVRADRAADADARTALLGELQAFAKEPGLAGQVATMEALLRLQNALSLTPGEQTPELNRAAQAAHAAVAAAPEDAERRALLAEILYFAKQDYVSKTEASVARLKNPLNGLAWAVLGLLAGPSTGEGTQQLMRARQADPFLWQSARAPGTPSFQGGILEATLRRWAVQHDQSGREKPLLDKAEREENQTMREGIAAFEAKRWEAAIGAFQKAADQDEYDYRPLLYQARILIETGRSPEALSPLRDLQAENPLENEVLLYLGVALEKTGNLEEARQSFQRILQDDPQQPVALYHAGLTAMAAKAWPAALEPLRTLVGIQPRHEDAWLQLGIAQANLEQWTGADDAFKQVLTINPKSQAAKEWRARIRSKLSR